MGKDWTGGDGDKSRPVSKNKLRADLDLALSDYWCPVPHHQKIPHPKCGGLLRTDQPLKWGSPAGLTT